MTASLHSLPERSDLKGKKVLVRASIDVPISPDGKIVDDFRLKKAIPTLQLLRTAGARVIIVGHTSRADGSSDISLEPVCRLLNSYLPVAWAGGILEDNVKEKIEKLHDGDLIMLENLRFNEGEKSNDPTFAKALASYAELYVNDAFSVSHREHASIVGIPQYLPSCAGTLFMDEFQHLSIAQEPKSPSLFVIGGAKFETKLPLVEKLLATYDKVFIGGALANNFFVARGYNVGKSLVSSLDITESPLFNSPKLLLPIDVTVLGGKGPQVKKLTEILDDDMILDAGPETMEMLAEEMRFVATVLWNGPIGDYERGFDACTKKFAEIVARGQGISIVGGGDTVASIKDVSVTEHFTFLSTAGGAMLSFLELGTLPGIEALRNTKV